MREHWLVRPGIIRLLWIAFLLVLALSLLAGVFFDIHAYFPLAGTFAFHAWFGFATCIGIIVFAKALGRLLHRKDSYYERD